MNNSRFFLTLSLLLFAGLVYAGGIKIIVGNAKYLKEYASIAVVFNWEQTMWNMEKPVKEHWGDSYQEYVDQGQASFIDGFNNASSKIKIVNDASSANIIMNITLKNFDYYFSVMSFVPGHKHKVWAEISIIQKETGNVLCKYVVDEFKGNRDFSVFDSYTEMMSKLASEIVKSK